MAKKKHLVAIFIFEINVSQFLTDALAFFKALLTPPGSTYVVIAPALITTAQTHVATAFTAETAVSTNADGVVAARDLAVAVVETDVRNFVMLVQAAANNALDTATATAIITACGLTLPKVAVRTKAEFAVKNIAKSPGFISLVFKAAKKGTKANYQVQESTDGATYTTIKDTPVSRSKIAHGKPPGTKMYYQGRQILSTAKGGEQPWIAVTPFNVV